MTIPQCLELSMHTFDLASPRLFVQPLRIPRFDDRQRRIDKHFNEGQRRLCVEFAREIAIRAVRRDERRQCDAARICEQFGNLIAEKSATSR